ncbi:MAG: DUF4097 domain-containing protein [Mageeibacillus sp.]|jgi:hypothetical protein|nr:DUF4097 domain-containing protein [Mageeibacillus sp.]MCI1263734.1 DUF4097 domain-containing protein [Saccharofermentans sp.]MCI1769233.1 DUF4097 domain-containing protein [Mageeibacillus sp.]MCI2044602.1 DUF4097 domain-containing protein [Mageeibacillus sp.]
MNKFNKVTVIVSSCLVVAGVLISIAGYIRGGALSYNIDFSRGFGHWYQQSHDRAVDKYELLSDERDIEGIDIDVEAGDVNITADSTVSNVSVSTNIPSENIQAEIDSEGILTVKDLRTEENYEGLNFDFGGFADDEYVTIVVPEETLDTLSVNVKYGDINISSVSAKEETVSQACGDFTADSCTVGSGNIENNCGDIRFNNSSVSLDKVTSDLGDIRFESCSILTDMAIESSCGDVDIVDTVNKCVYKADTDCGDVNLGGYDDSDSDASTPVVTADLSMGDFNVD